ncbi:hypothetical protein [Ensifer sp. LBL]|uniref:hypothetical protein n=1 Tax=Ensifer sp. LBL TaxID=2991056 RepID=UPI003D246907
MFIAHLPAGYLLSRPFARRNPSQARAIFGVGLLCSVLPDFDLASIAADIRWFFPFADLRVNLVHVQAVYKPWYVNFILHWTFALEVLIWLLAGHFALRDFRAQRAIGTA